MATALIVVVAVVDLIIIIIIIVVVVVGIEVKVESSSLRLWFVVARTSSLVISLLVLALGRDVVGMVVVVVVKRVWSLSVACRHRVAAVGIAYDVQGDLARE